MASYAAAIRNSLGLEVQTELGIRGQFDVQVDDKVVVSRRGGLAALLLRKAWPSEADVVNAVKTAQTKP